MRYGFDPGCAAAAPDMKAGRFVVSAGAPLSAGRSVSEGADITTAGARRSDQPGSGCFFSCFLRGGGSSLSLLVVSWQMSHTCLLVTFLFSLHVPWNLPLHEMVEHASRMPWLSPQ